MRSPLAFVLSAHFGTTGVQPPAGVHRGGGRSHRREGHRHRPSAPTTATGIPTCGLPPLQLQRKNHSWAAEGGLPEPASSRDDSRKGGGMAYEELKDRARAVWSSGDYSPTSRQLEPAADALVTAMRIGEAHTVLDVAAGDGNCAIAAARRGATVVATDFSPAMVAAGRARSAGASVDIQWENADAAALPFADGSFDMVTSVFGAIFAPEHDVVASELIRVLRRGGMVGMTAWTRDGFAAKLLEIPKGYAPQAADDAPDPFRWGDSTYARAVFESAGGIVQTCRRTVTFRYASWDEWASSSQAHGMAVTARQIMAKETYDEMFQRMQELTAKWNHAEGDSVAVDSDYLEVIVTKLNEA